METVDTWRLKFNSGTWRLVTAPPILRDGVMVARLVRAYHRELLKALEGKYIWPVSSDEERLLFAEFGAHYRHLADLVVPGVNPGDLTSGSRHEFFVATESHAHPNPEKDEEVRGLSGIERLLGYSYPEHDIIEGDQDEGAGDSDLSTLSIAFLTFPGHNVLEMAHVMSSTDLSGVVGFANRKAAEAQRESENKDKRPNAAIAAERPEGHHDDDEKFTRNKDLLLSRLQERGIYVPKGF